MPGRTTVGQRRRRPVAVTAGPTVATTVAQPAQHEVADEADHPEHDEHGEHRVDCAEALRPDDPVGQAVLGGQQLGDHEHQPRGGEVDAGDVDDAGHGVRQDHPAQHA